MNEEKQPKVVRHIPKIKKVRMTRLKKILMDKGINQKDLSKMLSILDDLRKGMESNDSGSSGNNGV
jgi:hypothetical protein